MAKTEKPNPEIKVIPPKKIVRKLAVGQEVRGRVRRLADFGAFIDIGVGTDGLVHVSEMSQKRVNKPSDILSVGDEVTAWIKSLDKEHNRISLTLLPPGTRTIRDLKKGEVVKGTVTRIEKYGVFVDIGVGYEGMVHVKEMAHTYINHPSDVVSIGDEIEAEVINVQQRRGRIDLSMRAVMPEPEPEPIEALVEEALEDEGEDEEAVPTVFEYALKKAQSKRHKKGGRRRKKNWLEDLDDDIISRTLQLAEE